MCENIGDIRGLLHRCWFLNSYKLKVVDILGLGTAESSGYIWYQ